MTDTTLAASLALLGESFGRDVWWLWRQRRVEPDQIVVRPGRPSARARRAYVCEPSRYRAEAAVLRPVWSVAWVITVLACLLVWFALVAPDQFTRLTLTGVRPHPA